MQAGCVPLAPGSSADKEQVEHKVEMEEDECPGPFGRSDHAKHPGWLGLGDLEITLLPPGLQLPLWLIHHWGSLLLCKGDPHQWDGTK